MEHLMSELANLDPRITITDRNGEEIEIYMSYGMINDLLKLLGSKPENILALDLDPILAEPLMATLLAKRDETGKILSNPVFDISMDDAERVFDWVKEHILGFFLRRLSSSKKVFEGHGDTMKALGLSENGMLSEASKTA